MNLITGWAFNAKDIDPFYKMPSNNDTGIVFVYMKHTFIATKVIPYIG